MARFKVIDMSPRLLPVDLEVHLVPGSFAHVLHHLIDPLDVLTFEARLPFGKVLVAIAIKHARQLWAMLALDVDSDPQACVQHRMRQHTKAA